MTTTLHIGIIGGGPAGYVAASHAAATGARVTLVEQASMGGACLQRGCIPTKRLVVISHLIHKIREAERFGIELAGQAIPRWEKMRAGIEQLVSGIERGLQGS
ncbi:MAG: FAD-dependent oxidoreductase [Methylococcales bacterium]